MAASVEPPAPAEEQVEKRDVEDVKVEGAKKNEDRDAMDVEPAPAQLPLKHTIKHVDEHHPHNPALASVDGKEAEDSPHVH